MSRLAPVEQAGEGRPRVYCDTVCRRVAEYRTRSVMTLLSTAEKAEQRARMALALPYGRTTDDRKTARAWRTEVGHLEEQLSGLLAPEVGQPRWSVLTWESPDYAQRRGHRT